MTTKQQTKFAREGDYVAEVAVDLVLENDGWAPYLSSTDAEKLDTVREALRNDSIGSASKLAKMYELTRVTG